MMNNVILPVYVKPERYDIMLKPDFEKFTFEGEEIIYLTLDKPTKLITLHAIDLKIASPEASVSYDKKAETATLTFPKKLPKGKAEIKLKFTGILNDKMRGFYRSKYGENKYLATTQFESTDARRAFPCFDEPAQKAIFEVTLIVPSHLTAISNTIETDTRQQEDYKIVRFAPTPKMSTYLLAFIVGDFEFIEKGRVRVFTTPGKKKQAQFALDVAVKCLEYYEDYFKIDYPLPVLDMIAIPDFAAGAMENWGAVTYRESTLLIDEAASSSANKQWVALVIAHELAHQWFGNLVTMKWWNDLWLNEGFASFIEFLAIDKIYPEFDVWSQFVSTEMADAFALDALKNTHPIEVRVCDPAEISEIFDRVSYSKGASILRMLWSYLGEKVFQKGLQYYLKKHAYSNAETQDLWQALEEISGKPVGKIMKNWTKKAGHPLVRVQATGYRLQLTQSRFFSSTVSKKQTKDTTVWNIPIDGFLMDKKSMQIANTGDKLNKGEKSLVRVNYPKNYLKKQKLDAVDRLGLIRDSFDLVEAGYTSTVSALESALDYQGERDYIVWSELTGKLSKLESLLAYEDFFNKFQNYGRRIYANIAQKMGWIKRAGEKHTDSLLRGIVLYKLGSFGDLETIEKAQKLFGTNIEPDLRSVVYNLVAKNGDKDEFETLVKMYKKEENQQEKDRLGRSLGLFKNKEILQKVLQFAVSADVRFQNTLQIIVSVWSNPKGRYLAWEFAKANWKMLKARYAGGHYFTKAFLAMGDFTLVSDAKDIEKFISKNPTPEAKRTIAQALEQIYSNAEWLKRDKKGIKNWLEKFD